MTLPDEPAPTRRQRAFYVGSAIFAVGTVATIIGFATWGIRREPSAAQARRITSGIIVDDSNAVKRFAITLECETCTVIATTADGQIVTLEGLRRVEVDGVPIPTPRPGQR